MSLVNRLNSGMSQYLVDSLNSGDLRASLGRRMEEQQQAALEAAQNAEQTDAVAAVQANSNPMAGNFAQRRADSGSKYVQATLDGVKKDSALAESQKSNIFAILNEVQAFAKSLRPAEIERVVNRSRDRKLYTEVEKITEEMKAEMERKVAEAAMPKDAEGKPIPTGAEAVSAEAVTEIATPEASAPVTELPDMAAETALSQEQIQYAATANLTGGSIDIKV